MTGGQLLVNRCVSKWTRGLVITDTAILCQRGLVITDTTILGIRRRRFVEGDDQIVSQPPPSLSLVCRRATTRSSASKKEKQTEWEGIELASWKGGGVKDRPHVRERNSMFVLLSSTRKESSPILHAVLTDTIDH